MSLAEDLLTDLDTFFSDFGVDAVWNNTTFKVIFHNAYEAVTLFGLDIESKNPYVEIKDSNVPGIAQGDAFTVNGTPYKVIGIQPDGTGITILTLSKD